MKRLNLVFLVIGVSIIFFGCSKDDFLTPELDESDLATSSLKAANKPAPNLIGEMDLLFNPGPIGGRFSTWQGTIDIEGDEYGMRFFPLTPKKEFSQASPFEEDFEIFELEDGSIVLAGHDAGVTTLANKPPDPCKFRMNGEIDVANAPFEKWIGRKVHMSGSFTWRPKGEEIEPDIATGTFRIN